MGDEEELGISQSKGEQAHSLAEKDAPRGRSHRHSSRVRPGERLGADKAAPVSRQSPSNTTGMCREPGPQQGLRRSRGADSKHGELCVGKQGRGSDRNTEDFFFLAKPLYCLQDPSSPTRHRTRALGSESTVS